jgi:polyisoprenyl-phosphate glycosyltransferase
VTESNLPTLSIILPVYNEADVIQDALDGIRAAVTELDLSFELVVVDDGSTDRTLNIINEASKNDPRVVPVFFSRNFGKEAALAAGLQHARGDAVVLMDADLQHPPSVISEMVAKWHEGFDVVNAVKKDRGDQSIFYRLFAGAFNRLMGAALQQSFSGASDFKLLDRQAVDAVNNCGERSRFFRGLVAWVGFRTASVSFDVADRAAGYAKWSALSLIRYSLKNLVAFTSLPLKVISLFGFLTVLLSVCLGIQTLYNYLSGRAVSGFTTVILLLILIGGVILVSIGVVGIYIAQIYHEQKQRPVYVEQRHLRRGGDRADSSEMP